jgi:hypothetical protein
MLRNQLNPVPNARLFRAYRRSLQAGRLRSQLRAARPIEAAAMRSVNQVANAPCTDCWRSADRDVRARESRHRVFRDALQRRLSVLQVDRFLGYVGTRR